MISFILPGVPISSNHAYWNNPKGGRTLTKEGKRYKTETSTSITKNLQEQIRGIKADHPYGLVIGLAMNILNAGWPEKAKTRYKRLDVDNRVKLAQDAIVEALGIDDSQIMATTSAKIHEPNEAAYATYVAIYDYEIESIEDGVKCIGFD